SSSLTNISIPLSHFLPYFLLYISYTYTFPLKKHPLFSECYYYFFYLSPFIVNLSAKLLSSLFLIYVYSHFTHTLLTSLFFVVNMFFHLTYINIIFILLLLFILFT